MAYLSEIAKLTFFGAGGQIGTLHWYIGLFMSNGSVASEPLKHTISAYSALAECDSAGYARKNITSTISVTALGNGLIKVTAPSQLWTLLPASTHPIGSALIILDPNGTNSDTTNIPIVCDTVGFPRTPDGSDFPYLIPSSGFLQI